LVDKSGTYWLEVTDTNNCQGTDSVEVIVNPLPAVDIGGPYEICDHDSILLGTSSVYRNYRWSSGDESSTIYVNGQGDYWLEVIDSNGCRNSDTTIIIVHPLPYIYLGEDTTLRTNNALMLDAGKGFGSYQWNTGAGTQALPVNTSQAGEYEYWVRVSDSNSCAAADTILVTVKLTDAMPDYTKDFNLKVYPNPTSGMVYLMPQRDIDSKVSISVIDAEGRMVLKDKIEGIRSDVGISIDLSGLENGIYLLMIDQYPVRIIKNSR
jgi:hypothetical protein